MSYEDGLGLVEVHIVADAEGAVGGVAVSRKAVAGFDFRVGQGDAGDGVTVGVVTNIAQGLCFYSLGFKIVEKIVIITLDGIRCIIVGDDSATDDIIRRIVTDGTDAAEAQVRLGRIVVANFHVIRVIFEKRGRSHEGK